MPRGKKTGRRGNARGVPTRGFQASFAPLASSPSHRRVLTMEEEARNTERHTCFSGSDHNLRHTKVSFVSAGPLQNPEAEDSEAREEQDDPRQAMEFMSLNSPLAGSDLEAKRYSGMRVPDGEEAIMKIDCDQLETRKSIGREGRSSKRESLTGNGARLETSPAPSNSSEEVILFRGRAPQGKTTRQIEERIKLIEEKIHQKEELLTSFHNEGEFGLSSAMPKNSSPRQHGSKNEISHKRRRRGNLRDQKAHEESLIADYIENIDKDDALFESPAFKQRELGGAEDNAWQVESDSFSAGFNNKARKAFEDGWDHSYVSDFDDMSTSDATPGDVQAVLSKRERKAGSQYLIVVEGQSQDEARWVPASSLISGSAIGRIKIFEAEAKLMDQLEDDDDSTDSDESDEELADEDDDDLLQRKVDRMTDEEIARILSKQEELGFGSAEVVLFDGLLGTDEDNGPAATRRDFDLAKIYPQQRPIKAQRGKRRQEEFPSASALADAYDGFDVMDFDRPSLKKKPKGRRGKLAFDLSDSEFEASMEMAWNVDRLKKKKRKEERESLRQQGLLGRKSNKPDLKQKYKEGMSMDAVKDEIKQFLMSENITTLALPPMDKADRKIVHEFANAFNLKSKSAGNGNSRFPVLYRTKRTMNYTDHVFDSVEARLTRRYFPRMDVKGRSSRAGGGANNAAVSYRDGDIVGASAPVLGIENRGRAMLEKMGWSSGTALGALNNKGILEPVSHVVKTTKAGLG